jgi:hypothetical protein
VALLAFLFFEFHRFALAAAHAPYRPGKKEYDGGAYCHYQSPQRAKQAQAGAGPDVGICREGREYQANASESGNGLVFIHGSPSGFE